MSDSELTTQKGRRDPALWFGTTGSAVAWAVHLAITYPLVEVSCQRGQAVSLRRQRGAGTGDRGLMVGVLAALAPHDPRGEGQPGQLHGGHRGRVHGLRRAVGGRALHAGDHPGHATDAVHRPVRAVLADDRRGSLGASPS